MAFWRKTISAIITTFVLACMAAPSFGATSLKLKVPWDHEYLYWVSSWVSTMPANPQKSWSDGWLDYGFTWGRGAAFLAPHRFKGESTIIELPDELKTERKSGLTEAIFVVYDVPTGNEAMVRLSAPLDPKGLALDKRDFNVVGHVRIKITADRGKPVESALVKLRDKVESELLKPNGSVQIARIDPTSVGVAEFRDISAGDATVEILYGDGKKASQDITIPEERDEKIFEIEVPVAGEVATVKETATGERGEATSKHEKGRKSGAEFASALLGSLFGFLVLIGIVVGAYYYLKSKGASVESTLKKLGVKLPEYEPETQIAPPSAEPAVDPNVCQFCGQKKDAQGRCACTLGAAPAPTGASTGPRLIGTQGSYAMNIFELTSDITTLGREPDNTIPLSNDSTVSRHHARISREGGGFVVYDAGSSNGVFVNGEKVAQRPLQPGDEVQLGSSKFRFEI